MKRGRLAILIPLLLMTPPSQLRSTGHGGTLSRIIAATAGNVVVYRFVPAETIASDSVGARVLTEGDWAELERRLIDEDQVAAAEGPAKVNPNVFNCLSERLPRRRGASELALRYFSRLLDDAEFVALIAVEELSSGWSPERLEVQTLAEVQVLSILRIPEHARLAEIALVQRGGEIRIRGRIACSEFEPELPVLRVGERYLIAGALIASNGPWLVFDWQGGTLELHQDSSSDPFLARARTNERVSRWLDSVLIGGKP